MHEDGKRHGLYPVQPRQVSRASVLWRKLFSVKGEAPEPVPTLDVGREPVEQQFLNGWRCYTDSLGNTGDATHQAQIVIQFPAGGTPMIAVLTRLEVFYTPATIGNPIKIGWRAVGPTPSGNVGKPRDARLGLGTGQLRNQGFNNAAAIYSVAVDVYPVSVAGTFQVHQPILFPDEQIVITDALEFVIASSANAETIQVRYSWKERALEPSEVSQS